MWRWLLGIGVLLAGLLYFWLVKGAGECDLLPGTEPRSASTAAESRSPDSNDGARPAPVAPLRMRAEDRDGAGTAETLPRIVPGKRVQVSLAAAFEDDSPGDAVRTSARAAMVRSVVSELAASELGATTIRELECRAHHCRLQLGGEDQNALIGLVDALQDDRGFYGKAESMMLGRAGDDLALYLRFPADTEPALTPNSP